MSREIFLIRHGQTDYNLRGIVQGRGIDASLNAKGLEQAGAFFRAFESEGFDHIYVSKLKRTFETVQRFVDMGIPHTKHAELDEIDWGTHEGKQATPEMRVYYKEIVDGWSTGELTKGIDGGESPLQVQERMLRFREHFEKEAPAKSLIACHGRAMRVMLCTLLGYPLTRMDEFPHKNLALYKLREVEGSYTILEANNTKHLEI